MKLPDQLINQLLTGSGVIECAIRRVVNIREKSPASFWKLNFFETVISFRAQVLYGRWDNIIMNWAHLFRNDFKEIVTKAAI